LQLSLWPLADMDPVEKMIATIAGLVAIIALCGLLAMLAGIGITHIMGL